MMKRLTLALLDRLLGHLAVRLQNRRDRALIALFHRVSPNPDPAYPPLTPELFLHHCILLSNYFTVIPLRELVERHRAGRSVARCCSITFDDGYRDFLDHAYPVLRRLGLPATHFLVADCVLSGAPTWNWRINHLAQRNQADLRREREYLASLDSDARDAWLAEREEGLPGYLPPAMLRPEHLAQFDSNIVSWGSHTVSHANLGQCSATAARRELAESKTVLQDVVNGPIPYTSYPNDSWTPQTLSFAREAGYEAAFAVESRFVTARSPTFALPRLDLGACPPRALRLEVSGFTQSMRDLRQTLTARMA